MTETSFSTATSPPAVFAYPSSDIEKAPGATAAQIAISVLSVTQTGKKKRAKKKLFATTFFATGDHDRRLAMSGARKRFRIPSPCGASRFLPTASGGPSR